MTYQNQLSCRGRREVRIPDRTSFGVRETNAGQPADSRTPVPVPDRWLLLLFLAQRYKILLQNEGRALRDKASPVFGTCSASWKLTGLRFDKWLIQSLVVLVKPFKSCMHAAMLTRPCTALPPGSTPPDWYGGKEVFGIGMCSRLTITIGRSFALARIFGLASEYMGSQRCSGLG